MDNPQRSALPVVNRECFSETFCRLCSSQIHELHRVFPPNGHPNNLLVRKIEYCTSIEITFGKDSNACICTKCIALVEEFFRFKKLCSSTEQWLKVEDNGGNHVASGSRSSAIDNFTFPKPMLERFNSNSSLITVGSGDVDIDDPLNDETQPSNISVDGPFIKLEDSAEQVTSSGHCMRARKPTTRVTQSVPANPMTKIPVKSESESSGSSDDEEASTSGSESSDSREFSPVVEHTSEEAGVGSQGFSLVRGTKSRSNRLYLVYQTHRYSNPSNDGKIWRCTHRAPVYCRAMVMLEKNRVIELNNHQHNHPPPYMSRRKKPDAETSPSSNQKDNMKISLVLKKEKGPPLRRPSTRACNQPTKPSEPHKWFIKANRKTVGGFTYTFCGLRKDGIIRLKCISKGCAGRVYMYSNGDLFRTNKEHNHPPHVAA